MAEQQTNFFTGKTVWIIGATFGIGESLAYELASQGANIIISARTQEKIDNLKSQLAGEGHIPLPLDVTDLYSYEKAKDVLQDKEIDFVIYFAGTYKPMPADDIDLDMCFKTIKTNINGIFPMLDFIIPKMKDRKKGCIILVGSVAGYVGLPNALAYSASKAAVISLAETLKAELYSSDIDIKVVNPGFVKTRLTDKNEFEMPGIITTEQAAKYIAKGIKKSGFEIHFPKKFTYFMKFLKILPYFAAFKILSRLTPKK